MKVFLVKIMDLFSYKNSSKTRLKSRSAPISSTGLLMKLTSLFSPWLPRFSSPSPALKVICFDVHLKLECNICCLGTRERKGAITNNYSQPEGDGGCQVQGSAEALLTGSCLYLGGERGHI